MIYNHNPEVENSQKAFIFEIPIKQIKVHVKMLS